MKDCAVVKALPFTQSLIILLGFLAVFIQAFVVQTHIHIPPQSVSAAYETAKAVTAKITAHAAAPVAPRDKYPINEDPSNCPLCQEFAHSGQFVHSVAVLASLPFSVTVSIIVFRDIAPRIFAVSHAWRGRAPPHA
jgi:hypothetical protein